MRGGPTRNGLCESYTERCSLSTVLVVDSSHTVFRCRCFRTPWALPPTKETASTLALFPSHLFNNSESSLNPHSLFSL
ncbi:hypothetical protein AAHA92_06859 [Salvia divinorum]|uniref:Uncharacterized protein n=1 Tax=Salvia divinorum TaxID=28513 RepID=A0ABD1I758_SALDI